jgi:hypothetical protein
MKVKIIVDIDVANLQIRACKPAIQTPMPNDDAGKMLFWNTVDADRLNKRQFGFLKGKALRKAESIVDRYGVINISGVYGSIEIDQNDFIPYEKNEIKERG